MKKILIFLCFCALAFASELKIASFNVENLFDGKNNGNEYSDFVIGKSDWSQEKYENKLDKLANLLKKIDADIISLQEIENYEVLKELANKSGYEYFAFSKDNSSPVGVAILSKIKIDNKEFFRAKEIKTRDILKCDFTLDGEKFSVYANHFLAYKNPLRKRKINLTLLEQNIRGVKNAIAVGDFNSKYGAKDSLIAGMVERLKMVDLWSFVNPSDRHSHIHNGAIDHAILSGDFFENKGLNYKNGSFKTLDNDEISDHYPIEFIITSSKQEDPALHKSGFFEMDKAKNSDLDTNIKENSSISSLNSIYGQEISSPVNVKDVVVTYKDKKGFVISQNHRGIYVFNANNHFLVEVGDRLDVSIKKTSFYNGNFQISKMKIDKKYSKVSDLSPYTLPASEISKARPGDVITQISGEIKDEKMNIGGREFIIFNHQTKWYGDGKYTFNNAYYMIFKGKDELIVQ